MIFEAIIILIAFILLILIFIKYIQKRHRLTLLLFFIFLCYWFAIFFSWLSKMLVLFSNIDYIIDDLVADPGTFFSWILLRIKDFRISFVFMSVAIFLSYILKVNVFEKGYNKVHRILVIIYTIITAGFSLFIYEKGNTLLDVIAFLFIFVFMAMIYIPFFIRSFGAYKESDDKIFKRAFLSLALMSIFFILIPLNFLLDRVFILFGDPGFTIFYFLAWTFALLGIIGAYFGYIRPRS